MMIKLEDVTVMPGDTTVRAGIVETWRKAIRAGAPPLEALYVLKQSDGRYILQHGIERYWAAKKENVQMVRVELTNAPPVERRL